MTEQVLDASKLYKPTGKNLREKITEVHQKHPDWGTDEIAKEWSNLFPDSTKAPKAGYIYKVIKALTDKEAIPNSTQELPDQPVEQPADQPAAQVTVEQPTVTTAEPTIEDIQMAEQVASQPNAGSLVNAFTTGKLTSKHIQAFFRIENKVIKTYLGEDCCFDEETIVLLGDMGVDPLNELLGQYMKGRTSLIVWIGLIIFAHAPIIMKLAGGQKWFQKLKGDKNAKPAEQPITIK